MEDKRFDSLTKALASGASRRSVLKGLFGLGAAAATGGVLLDDGADAARRPTPTPTVPKCPGNQTWNGTKCVCPTGLSQCVPGTGPACCNDQNVDPGEPGYSTCCDNACCQGTCYAEELCCATNNRPGELPPTNRICESVSGTECCLFSDDCCTIDGCCATTCFGGTDGQSYCCPAGDFCPGGSTSPELCCQGDTVCCGGGTNGNICADLSDDDNNCGACGHVCSGCSSCQNGACLPDDEKCEGTLICCPDGNTFSCEVGPNCGCDSDADCDYLDNAATCTAGQCRVVGEVGSCVAVPAANTVVCHPAGSGANAICDPAVMCSGETQSCPGPNYAQPGTDCGACMACNATGVCTAQCGVEEDCCPGTDKCVPDGATCCTSDTQCTLPCQICNEDLGYCVTSCTSGQSCCTLGDGAECCSTAPGFACCEGDGCVDTQTDDDNCGACGHVCPGCSTCQRGLCTATNSQCPVEGNVCCKSGDTYVCEEGPFCGCDVDGDCPACNRCNEGTCEPICTDSQECCPDLGTHGLCVSNVEGVGCCVSGDCTNTGEDDCLVGTCSATGVCSYAPDNALCIDENPCTDAICSAEGVCSFPSDCSNDPGICCPGCLDCSGTTCVENDANCTDTGTDACLVGACNADGTCTYTPNNALCDEGTPCQDGTCSAAGVCTYTGDCSNNPELCCPGCLDCSGTTCVQNDDNCSATGPDGCLVGTCNGDGTCSYAPDNNLCVDEDPCTDAICSAEGVCSYPFDCTNNSELCCPGCLVCNDVTLQCVESDAQCNDTGPDACRVGACNADGTCTYTPDNALCDEGTACQDGTCNADGSCTYTGDCSNDPAVCCPGCLDCSGTVCVENDANCTTPPNTLCYASPGDCTATGTCNYTPLDAGTPCGVCMFCDGAGACLASTDPCCGIECDPNACLECQGGTCVDICPEGTHCDGAGGCISDCIANGLACDPNIPCCGVCCDGICVALDSPCGQCITGCTGPDKCCCLNSQSGVFTCADRTGSNGCTGVKHCVA